MGMKIILYLRIQNQRQFGIINSPLYISTERGNSKLGSGKINYYIYFSKNNLDTDIYTSIFITVDGAKELRNDSKKYEDLIFEIKSNIKGISGDRQKARYDSLISEANAKIQEARDELNTEKEKAESEIANAENDLWDAENKVAEGERSIASNLAKANTEFANAEKQIKENEDKYNDGKKQAEEGIAQAKTRIKET